MAHQPVENYGIIGNCRTATLVSRDGSLESWGRAGWWLRASIGLVHRAFVLLVGMRLLPSIHPRMTSELHGPSPTRQLQPPGVAALHYVRRTPLATVAAHFAVGAMLGVFYSLS